MLKILITFVLLLLFTSCVYHRSYVATPYEPVLVKEKGDLTISAGIRPFKYYGLELTTMPAKFVAFRAGYGGFFNLDNFYGSAIFFKNFSRYGLFFAPTFTYQHNLVNRKFPFITFNNRRAYRYNCEYQSPGVVAGLRLLGDETDESFQIMLKAQYNVVSRYEYYFFSDNNSGKSYGYVVSDEEKVDKKIPAFISVEPVFVYLTPLSPNFIVKAHLAFNIVQRSFRHDYQYNDAAYSPQLHDAVSFHPKFLGMNVGLGIIFRHSKFQREPRG
jgi:hypothetical protein